MQHRTLAAIAAASLLAAFAAQAQKGAVYQAPPPEPEYSRFTLTGGATYLLPTMNGLDYVDYLFPPMGSPISTQEHNPLQIERDYNWGYFVAAGYMISDRYDAQVSWAQSNATNSSSASCASCVSEISSNLIENTLNNNPSATQETMDYQAFDGTLGQYHQLGGHLKTRVFAGVRYAKITNDTINTYSKEFQTDNFNSSFSGWGPELGFDANYSVYDWFSIVGHFDGAFLIGELDSDSNVSIGGSRAFIEPGSNVHTVPALDAKLGLNLSVPFMDMQDRFVIEAGYQVDYYFNVVNQIQTGFDGREGVVNNYADVALMGPYANVSVKF